MDKKEMGLHAKQYYESHFNKEKLLSELEDMFRKLIKERGKYE